MWLLCCAWMTTPPTTAMHELRLFHERFAANANANANANVCDGERVPSQLWNSTADAVTWPSCGHVTWESVRPSVPCSDQDAWYCARRRWERGRRMALGVRWHSATAEASWRQGSVCVWRHCCRRGKQTYAVGFVSILCVFARGSTIRVQMWNLYIWKKHFTKNICGYETFHQLKRFVKINMTHI